MKKIWLNNQYAEATIDVSCLSQVIYLLLYPIKKKSINQNDLFSELLKSLILMMTICISIYNYLTTKRTL